MKKPRLSTAKERAQESSQDRKRVFSELMARAEAILRWPTVRTRTELDSLGLVIVIEPMELWTREIALEALQISYELQARSLEDALWRLPDRPTVETQAEPAKAGPAKPRQRKPAKAPK